MATTPIWVTLVVAFLGLGSVMLTQHLANRREDARWRREREREQALWAREDAARSYEHRRDAYVDFIKEFNRLWNAFEEASSRGKFDPPDDYLVRLYDHVIQIQIFGTKEAAKLANKAFDDLFDGVFQGDDLSPYAVDSCRARYDVTCRSRTAPSDSG